MIGNFVRKNINLVLQTVAPQTIGGDLEKEAIRHALLKQAEILDPESALYPEDLDPK